DVHLFGSGDVRVHLYASPTQTIQAQPLRVATSFDDQAPVVVAAEASLSNASWENSVRDNIEPITISHSLDDEGAHTLKLWMVDPGIVIQKIVIQRGNLPVSYLGPPTETYTPPQLRDVGPLAIGASGEGDATDVTGSDNGDDSDDSSATTEETGTSGDVPAGGDASDLPADDTSSARRNQLKGCNCTIGERSSSPPWWVLSAAVGLLYVQRRRARSST